MKYQLIFLLGLAAATEPTPPPSLPGEKEMGYEKGEPPSSAEILLSCGNNGESASHDNIVGGIEEMRNWDPNDQECSANSDGSAARMAAGDGYSFYIKSVDSESVTKHACSSVIPDALDQIRYRCASWINDEGRAEGSMWIPGEEGKTFVYITGESK